MGRVEPYMQFQVVNIVIQVSSSLMDLGVGVPLLETFVGYARTSVGGLGIIGKEPHV